MYLLDTCAFIWYLEDSPRLSERVREILQGEDELYLSLASLWEIAIKKTIGKLYLSETTADLIQICKEDNIEVLSIDAQYFDTIQIMPYIHGDPFDRLIMATAIDNGLILLTDDDNIRKYTEVKQEW